MKKSIDEWIYSHLVINIILYEMTFCNLTNYYAGIIELDNGKSSFKNSIEISNFTELCDNPKGEFSAQNSTKAMRKWAGKERATATKRPTWTGIISKQLFSKLFHFIALNNVFRCEANDLNAQWYVLQSGGIDIFMIRLSFQKIGNKMQWRNY